LNRQYLSTYSVEIYFQGSECNILAVMQQAQNDSTRYLKNPSKATGQSPYFSHQILAVISIPPPLQNIKSPTPHFPPPRSPSTPPRTNYPETEIISVPHHVKAFCSLFSQSQSQTLLHRMLSHALAFACRCTDCLYFPVWGWGCVGCTVTCGLGGWGFSFECDVMELFGCIGRRNS
jgi:hypothetical protein